MTQWSQTVKSHDTDVTAGKVTRRSGHGPRVTAARPLVALRGGGVARLPPMCVREPREIAPPLSPAGPLFMRFRNVFIGL